MSDRRDPANGVRRLIGIRVCIVIVMAGLLVSGVTAFPLREEVTLGIEILRGVGAQQWAPGLFEWVSRVHEALVVTGEAYPFVAYGTDWLAFAHLLIAVAYIGPLRDPVRNIWVLQWGLIACAGIIPLAFIAGGIRGLPPLWQLIDISFGVFAAIPLTIAVVLTRRLEREAAATGAAGVAVGGTS